MTKYNTNLASEFYVLSMLHRLGADATLTLGNKKAVDIMVVNEDKTITTIDVKGVAKRYDWPADNIHRLTDDHHFYVFVCFEGQITNPLTLPSVWIIPAKDLKPFIREYKTRVVVSRAEVKAKGNQYENEWPLITGKESVIQ